MVLAKGKLPEDPRMDGDKIMPYTVNGDKTTPFKRPVLKYDEIPPDLWSLGALVFSFLGVTMKYRGCAWFGALFAVAAWANKRTHDADTKQIFTGAVFAIAGLSVNAINSYHGMQARAREAGASAPGAERDDTF